MMTETDCKPKDDTSNDCVMNISTEKSTYTYEDALDITGHGFYNRSLMLVLSLILAGMGLDMFGFSLVVVGCSCDFQLTMWQKSLLTSTPFAGTILTSYLWGYLSDTRGRRFTLLIGSGGGFIMAMLSAMSPNWIALAVLRLMGSSFCCSAQSVTTTLLGESCIQRIKGNYLMVLSIALMSIPMFLYPIAFYLLPLKFSYSLGSIGQFLPWRLLCMMHGLPLGVGFLGLLALYESPKFLVNMGREEDAIDIMRKIFVRNGGDASKFKVNKLILCEENNNKNRQMSLLKSIWEQTAPLFRRPLLFRTLQLYYLTVVLYFTNNSFTVWYPFIVDSFFTPSESKKVVNGLCEIITENLGSHASGNATTEIEIVKCSNTLRLSTVLGGVGLGAMLTVVAFVFSRVSSRRKLLNILIMTVSAVSAVAVTLINHPVGIIVLYITYLQTSALAGLMSAYFIDLYPTSYRGMVACLAVVVARSSGLIGTNIVGALITNHCRITFYTCSLILISGVVVAYYLPPDNPPKKSK